METTANNKLAYNLSNINCILQICFFLIFCYCCWFFFANFLFTYALQNFPWFDPSFLQFKCRWFACYLSFQVIHYNCWNWKGWIGTCPCFSSMRYCAHKLFFRVNLCTHELSTFLVYLCSYGPWFTSCFYSLFLQWLRGKQVQTSCDNGKEVPIAMARRCPKENKKYFSSHWVICLEFELLQNIELKRHKSFWRFYV
jgi:hypothetical protein